MAHGLMGFLALLALGAFIVFAFWQGLKVKPDRNNREIGIALADHRTATTAKAFEDANQSAIRATRQLNEPLAIKVTHARAIRLWLYVVAALVLAMVLVGGATRLTKSRPFDHRVEAADGCGTPVV